MGTIAPRPGDFPGTAFLGCSLRIMADATPEVPAKLAALGFTLPDWLRIREAIEAVTDRGAPPALWDLDAPYAVAAMKHEGRYPPNEETLGIVTRPDGMRVYLRYWELSEHDLQLREQRKR
jgi:hypothetical protein